MTRLRADRMRARAQQVRVSELLRESAGEVLTLADLEPRPSWSFLLPPISDEQAAEWQARWDETMADQPHRHRIITLPQRTVIRSERPRKSTPRGLPRMREHIRTLLLGALRGDGTPRSAARIAVCRAYRVLPGRTSGGLLLPGQNGA